MKLVLAEVHFVFNRLSIRRPGTPRMLVVINNLGEFNSKRELVRPPQIFYPSQIRTKVVEIKTIVS
jgi:hypothetical protein